jgi:hypothetical protein
MRERIVVVPRHSQTVQSIPCQIQRQLTAELSIDRRVFRPASRAWRDTR